VPQFLQDLVKPESSSVGQPATPYQKSILVVDDDLDFQDLLRHALQYDGYNVATVESLTAMEEAFTCRSFDAVLLDYRLGEEDGLRGIEFLLKNAPDTRVVMLTGFGSIELAVDAMGMGASYFLTKSVGPKKITDVLRKILNCQSNAESPNDIAAFEKMDLIGRNLAFLKVLAKIEKFKDVDSTVLVTGESGTGKELIARAIHFSSLRAAKPFRAINCAAIPENLIESELFGHKKGSFTDAKADRKGLFEECSEGTILLDEIGEMPLGLQAKLLRVLQEREVTPVGASRPVPINTRVIASTNRDLKEEVKAGRFRQDLYFRLSVLHIIMPPLRHRSDDIPLLVNKFISRFNGKFSKQVRSPSTEVMSRLVACDWPGNVRELCNAIERAVVLSNDGDLHLEDIFQHQSSERAQRPEGEISLTAAGEGSLSEVKRRVEEESLRRVLRATKGNISRAARTLGIYRANIYRANIYRMIDRYDIDLREYKH